MLGIRRAIEVAVLDCLTATRETPRAGTSCACAEVAATPDVHGAHGQAGSSQPGKQKRYRGDVTGVVLHRVEPAQIIRNIPITHHSIRSNSCALQDCLAPGSLSMQQPPANRVSQYDNAGNHFAIITVPGTNLILS